MPELPFDDKAPANDRRGAARASAIDLVLAFDELLTLQAISALAARDPRFRIVSRLGEAWPGDALRGPTPRPCVALVDGRRPPQSLTGVLQYRGLMGCVVLTERHTGANGTVRLPVGNRHSSLPWGAPWGAVADALIDTYRAGVAGAPNGRAMAAPLAWEAERARLGSLTRRERQVMHLIAEGLAVREIAGKLHLAESTIDNHKSRLMKKIGAKKSVDIVRFACRVGAVAP